MRELFSEILNSIKKNKLRTFLTGFSVAWGIFMLIILLGAGNGLKNGVMKNFNRMSTNTIGLGGGTTSEPFGGYQSGRRIKLTKDDITLLKNEFKNISSITSEVSRVGRINYGKEFLSAVINGVDTNYDVLEDITVLRGRFINQSDIDNNRKVIVIDDIIEEILFGKRSSAIGKWISFDQVSYKVIGITKRSAWNGSQNITYIPIDTYFVVYSGQTEVGWLTLEINNINDIEQTQAFETKIRKRLGIKHEFKNTDRRALSVWNTIEQFMQVQLVFTGIEIFIWIIGLGTLLAGIVGVSNIMLVTVRERTFEFGIRKSMGASPASLVRLILLESVIITAVFGYVGMIGGIGVMEIVNIFVDRSIAANPDQMAVIFLNPTLNLGVVVSATIVLIVSGMIGGYIPARRAAKIKTIDALRHNK